MGARAHRALGLLRAGLTDIPSSLGAESLDRLAADYADIYLTNGLRASPCESVWLDEDGLVMQGPMFDVRACYSRHGLAVPDWRRRSDDHLVHQLLVPGPSAGANFTETCDLEFTDDSLLDVDAINIELCRINKTYLESNNAQILPGRIMLRKLCNESE